MLSGGEPQRVRLAAQPGSNLRGVRYILDEPTIGRAGAQHRPPRPAPGPRRLEPHRTGRGGGPDAHRQDPALGARLLRRVPRRDPPHLRAASRGADARVHPEPVLLQRERRAVRRVLRPGQNQEGNELPARRVRELRRVRRPALQRGNPVGPVQRQEHRRGAADDRGGGGGVLPLLPQGLPAAEAAG